MPMDRSYPYSRRLLARARLRKRTAALAAAGLVGAAAVFMLAWEPDPIPGALPAPAMALPALGDGLGAGEPASYAVRRIYPYSVVPGGVSGQAELKRVIRTDTVVAAHYATFDTDKAHAVVVDKPRAVHVSYRRGDKVYWTAHKVMLAPGETLLSDGSHEMRARCANRISDTPQYPVEAHRPAMAELDQPLKSGEGEQLAFGPDGLPVSMGIDGMGRQPGVRVPVGSNAAGGGADNGASATLASSSSSSGTGAGPLATMGLSGSSSSLGRTPWPGGRLTGSSPAPRPGNPAAPDDADSSDGASGGAAPAPHAGAGEPAATPLPDAPTPLPPRGATPSPDAPAADPRPAAPAPTPAPGTGPVPVRPPQGPSAPTVPSQGELSGGGPGEAPPAPPTGSGPQPSRPDPATDPMPPQSGVDPAPPAIGNEEPAPTEVPEPASIWLSGLALAAMAVLRRRRA